MQRSCATGDVVRDGPTLQEHLDHLQVAMCTGHEQGCNVIEGTSWCQTHLVGQFWISTIVHEELGHSAVLVDNCTKQWCPFPTLVLLSLVNLYPLFQELFGNTQVIALQCDLKGRFSFFFVFPFGMYIC